MMVIVTTKEKESKKYRLNMKFTLDTTRKNNYNRG